MVPIMLLLGVLGAGGATDAPITDTGEIIAAPQRTVAVSTVSGGAARSALLPLGSYSWDAAFDPSDRAPFAIDWSGLLAAGETILQIDRITMSAEGASLGLMVDTDPPRRPIISTDHKKTQFWFVCASAFQNHPAFMGGGVQVGLSVLIRTSAATYKQFERTAVLTVRQQ